MILLQDIPPLARSETLPLAAAESGPTAERRIGDDPRANRQYARRWPRGGDRRGLEAVKIRLDPLCPRSHHHTRSGATGNAVLRMLRGSQERIRSVVTPRHGRVMRFTVAASEATATILDPATACGTQAGNQCDMLTSHTYHRNRTHIQVPTVPTRPSSTRHLNTNPPSFALGSRGVPVAGTARTYHRSLHDPPRLGSPAWG